MGSWGEILREVTKSGEERGAAGPDLDGIRLKYIEAIRQVTGRAVIVYASGWLRKDGSGIDASVTSADVHALMESCHGVEDRRVDLIIHSPGGSPTAAEQMINYLRTQFDELVAYIPLQAKSAATMMALGCDEIWMGRHSELGPIDPQVLIPVAEGQRYAPAHAIVRDFDRAKREIAENITALPAWTPILRGYAGGLLDFCTQQIKLSQEVVAKWLEQYMLAHGDAGIAEADRASRALEIAEYFGSDVSYERFKTHGRPIRIEELSTVQGLRVRALEENDKLQDAVLSLYHTLDISFGGPAIKIVENHKGARYVRAQQQLLIPIQPSQPAPPLPSPPLAPGVPQPPTPSRAERRRQERGRK